MEERKRMGNSKVVQEQGIEKRARFDIIRYANCWEDADALIPALNVKAGGAYLSIASAGDNSLALLSKRPSLVLAVDISPAQLACLEIRKAAFKDLSYEQLLDFTGVRDSGSRESIYQGLRRDLSAAARLFWDERGEFIKRGIIHTGKFEHYFSIFRKFILPLVHSRRETARLLTIHDDRERRSFYNDTWNTWRWKMLFRIFFSRKMMGALGRDPQFFKYVETDVAKRIFNRAEYALTMLSTDANPYLEYILTGNFGNSLPFYLRRENFQAIRDNLDKLVIFRGNLSQALGKEPGRRFDGFNLSDIFEYMSCVRYKEEITRILKYAKAGARLVYWNMLADRRDIDGLEGRLKFLDEEAARLFKRDKAFFYKSLIIGEAI